MKTVPYLHLDRIKHDLKVEKLLPPEVARQYHALPISFDGHQVTVAISSPDDPAASTVVSSSLGKPVCFVRADLSAIDHRLAEVWPGNPEPACKMLMWTAGHPDGSPPDDTLTRYAEYLAELLHATLYRFEPPVQPKETLKELNFALAEFRPDLLVAGLPGGELPGNVPKPGLAHKFLKRLPVSTLTARTTRWPIKKILLVLIESSPDSDLAIEWAGKFALPGRAEVNILPVLPPVPPVYGVGLHYSIPSLLMANDPFGQTARRIAEHFSDIGIQASFRLRQGDPADQIYAEIGSSDPDLVILAAEDPRPLHRALAGSLLKPIWQASNCPVLIAKQAW